MKLVTLNLWQGIVKDVFDDFFNKYPDIDIWCFQEVFKNGYPMGEPTQSADKDYNFYEKLEKYLGGYNHEFCQVLKGVYGTAIFVRKDIRIKEKGEILVARGDWEDLSDLHNRDHHRKLQWVELVIDDKPLLLSNAHFTHRPEGKRDSEKRLNQSKTVADFLAKFDITKVLVGDFNLSPDTESIRIIEDVGMRNLVKEYAIESTRTKLYRSYETGSKFADYVFASPEIKVCDFKVLPDVVSDHSPLMLDFDL